MSDMMSRTVDRVFLLHAAMDEDHLGCGRGPAVLTLASVLGPSGHSVAPA